MLKCTECFKEYTEFRYLCDCGGVLLVEYKKLEWMPEGKGVWRYKSLLPFQGMPITLKEGNTPLVKRRDVPEKVYMKLEGDNPTGSFKDRGTTVVLSHARSTGYKAVGVASTGNMGASVSAYAAYGNLKAKVFIPADTPKNKVAQIIAYNAEIVNVKGSFHECVEELWKEVKKGLYLAETGLNPYYIEGEKTIAFEIFEEIGVPDKIVAPIGTGGLITAVFKGFNELKKMKLASKLPQMIGVQAKGCSPIINAFEEGVEEIKRVEKPKTIASAIMVKTPFNGHTAIRAMRESKGVGVRVTDAEIIKAIKELGKEGVFAEPAAAASLAALKHVDIKKDERIVLIITGHGLKQPEIIEA